MARKAQVATYKPPKKKSHPHNKNASRLKSSKGYKKPYRGQGR
ncbi:MAG: hypothetical protein Unbinned2072contig1001_32 [Prokaryotic dsDNA virus sp.]|jgi:hypothetical protein|nr:MAG: hypothetical protein Unbinned2072contig1001_32 [Prokaryotic dsDNA virus sp.]|tara:strand:+ start:6100 stop:6228 length:129 start_codon:yes stop_codon:yes gene_type:complete